MTVHLSQTILFGIIFGVVPLLVTGRRLWMGQAAAALVALGVWLASVVLCAVLERGGHAGPFETLLRTARRAQRAQEADAAAHRLARNAAGTAAGPLSRPDQGPSAGRMAGRQAPPFGGDDLGA